MFNKEAFQAAFADALQNNEFNKVAQAIVPYIRTSVYEGSFIEQVLAERPVSQAELIPEVGNNDTVYVIGQIEHGTPTAITMNFWGKPYMETDGGRRYKIPIGMHSTPIFRKPQMEMMAFNYDFFGEVAQKEVFALQKLRDQKLISMLNACIGLSGKEVSFPAPDANTVIHLEKDHLVAGFNMLETGDRQGIPGEKTLVAKKILLSQTMINDLALWNSVDVDTLAADLAVKGWASTTLIGKEFIVSSKADLFVEKDGSGNIWDVIWVFPDPEFIGEVIKLTGYDIKEEIWKKEGTDIINRRSYETFGAGIGNYNGVAKIRLMRKKNA